MKILITGGSGFIGSHFIRLMLGKYPEMEIVNLDKLTYAGNLENTVDFSKNRNYRFVKGDICNLKKVLALSKNVDGIVNFAAESHVDRAIMEAGVFVKTDVLGTYVLLEAARRNCVEKYLQISTDEVYGSIKEGSFTEKSKFEPNSPYSASKAGAELLVRSYGKTYGLKTLITRSSNNYGPYQHPEKLIPLFITNLLRRKKVPVYGNGLNVRDWLYVEDNCRAIDLVFQKGMSGEAYNIGGNCEKTNVEVTRMILKLMNRDESFIEYVEDRKGHDYRYSLDSSKMNALGWKIETKFEEGLKETIDWYKKNEKWWGKLVS